MSPPSTAPDWDAVYEAQIGRIYNYFLYRVNQRATAEDLTATTFQRAWKNRTQYDAAKGSAAAWLFGIARYVLADHYRQQPPNTVSIEKAYTLQSDQHTERDALRQLSADQLGHILAQLPERDQDLIALKYGAEMTNRAIADLLDMSESNVGTRLHRLVNQLRGLIQQQGGNIRYGS